MEKTYDIYIRAEVKEDLSIKPIMIAEENGTAIFQKPISIAWAKKLHADGAAFKSGTHSIKIDEKEFYIEDLAEKAILQGKGKISPEWEKEYFSL